MEIKELNGVLYYSGVGLPDNNVRPEVESVFFYINEETQKKYVWTINRISGVGNWIELGDTLKFIIFDELPEPSEEYSTTVALILNPTSQESEDEYDEYACVYNNELSAWEWEKINSHIRFWSNYYYDADGNIIISKQNGGEITSLTIGDPNESGVNVNIVGETLTFNGSKIMLWEKTENGGYVLDKDVTNVSADGTLGVAHGSSTQANGDSSHAEGTSTNAKGEGSHSEGNNTSASGKYSHSEGNNASASGEYSHAEGISTNAEGEGAHAEGISTNAEGEGAHAEGKETGALSDYAHAEGESTNAEGRGSHSEGNNTSASGKYSHAEGKETEALSDYAHAEGESTNAEGKGSHAEGKTTIASGQYAHAEGEQTTASGKYSHAEGHKTEASNQYAHAEGSQSTASGKYSHAEGGKTNASSNYAHAEGGETQASGEYSHAEGQKTHTYSDYSHAEGKETQTNGKYAHAEGYKSNAAGDFSHAEGSNTNAYGEYSHAEGRDTTADANYSHSEGYGTSANHEYSHAEGKDTVADNKGAHAEGDATTASGNFSHTEGVGTKAQNISEHAEGSYNTTHRTSDTYGNSGNTQHSIGIGTKGNNENAVEVMQNGDFYMIGVGGYRGTDTKVQDPSILTVQEVINGTQHALIEGDNIDITNNVISVVGIINDSVVSTSSTYSSTKIESIIDGIHQIITDDEEVVSAAINDLKIDIDRIELECEGAIKSITVNGTRVEADSDHNVELTAGTLTLTDADNKTLGLFTANSITLIQIPEATSSEYGFVKVDNTLDSTSTNPVENRVITSAISSLVGIRCEVVSELPATGENGTIYFVPNGGSEQNIYDEYIWIDSTSKFELIGTTEIDLSNYVTKDDLNTTLLNYVSETDVTNILNNYVTDSEFDNLIEDINIQLSDIDRELSTKQDKLTEGYGIDITGNTISVESDFITESELNERLSYYLTDSDGYVISSAINELYDTKQDKLTAGDNITISNDSNGKITIDANIPKVKHELIYFNPEKINNDYDGLITAQLMYEDGIVVDNESDFNKCKGDSSWEEIDFTMQDVANNYITELISCNPYKNGDGGTADNNILQDSGFAKGAIMNSSNEFWGYDSSKDYITAKFNDAWGTRTAFIFDEDTQDKYFTHDALYGYSGIDGQNDCIGLAFFAFNKTVFTDGSTQTYDGVTVDETSYLKTTRLQIDLGVRPSKGTIMSLIMTQNKRKPDENITYLADAYWRNGSSNRENTTLSQPYKSFTPASSNRFAIIGDVSSPIQASAMLDSGSYDGGNGPVGFVRCVTERNGNVYRFKFSQPSAFTWTEDYKQTIGQQVVASEIIIDMDEYKIHYKPKGETSFTTIDVTDSTQKALFDEFKNNDVYYGFWQASTPKGAIYNISYTRGSGSSLSNLILNTYDDAVWQYTYDGWQQLTQYVPLDLFSGSRLNYNNITNKLFYSNGSRIYELETTGGGEGEVGTLNTTNTTSLTPQSGESLSGTIDLHKISKTGSYSDLIGKPTLATVATSGSYNDLNDKPTIPAAQINADWNATSGVTEILNKPTLATVATSGSYNDLNDKPTIPTIGDGLLCIKVSQSGSETTVIGFGANQSDNDNVTFVAGSNITLTPDTTNKTITIAATGGNITVPTNDATYPILLGNTNVAESNVTSIQKSVGLVVNPNKKSVAEGNTTTASGYASHAEGEYTTASGDYSHAGGQYTIANRDAQTVVGKYNDESLTDALFVVGNGTGIDSASRSNAFYVENGGDVYASGAYYAASDKRKKDIIGDIDLEKAYSLLEACQTVTYTWKDDESKKQQIGVIAQEIQQFFPEIVNEDEHGMLSVDYSRLTVILMTVIKNNVKEMKSLEERIKLLEEKIG